MSLLRWEAHRRSILVVWGRHVGTALAVTNVLEKAESLKRHMETEMETL